MPWCGTLGSKRVKPPATWATRYVYFNSHMGNWNDVVFCVQDYKAFVCVEAAAIERLVVLPAGETWECEQVLESVKLAAPAIGAAPEEVKAEA